jgi:hypothetical protein
MPRSAGSRNVFRREGEYWTIIYDGRVTRIRDTKGVRYIARLLEEPGRRLRAVELVAGPQATAVDPVGAERSRVNVSRAIKAAREKIAANAPDLGRHLETTLHTGVRCAYVPDARVPIRWRL